MEVEKVGRKVAVKLELGRVLLVSVKVLEQVVVEKRVAQLGGSQVLRRGRVRLRRAGPDWRGVAGKAGGRGGVSKVAGGIQLVLVGAGRMVLAPFLRRWLIRLLLLLLLLLLLAAGLKRVVQFCHEQGCVELILLLNDLTWPFQRVLRGRGGQGIEGRGKFGCNRGKGVVTCAAA